MKCSERDQLEQTYVVAMHEHVIQEEKLKGTQSRDWQAESTKSKRLLKKYIDARRAWMVHRSEHGC
jgi:hypothetical protein